MNELRDSVASLGVPDPAAAITVHACIGADPALLAAAAPLPQSYADVEGWVKRTMLDGGNPLFERSEHAVAAALGDAPDERTAKMLRLMTVRARSAEEIAGLSDTSATETAAALDRFTEAGLVEGLPDPLDPDRASWRVIDRGVRFYFAMLEDHLERWRRGRITDLLWRRTHARFDRYVCRAEFAALCRAWTAERHGISATRVLVPDPRYHQFRTLEVAAWGEKEPVALGTIRWRFIMRHKQVRRLRYVRSLLGDPEVAMYCFASRFDPAFAEDPETDVTLVTPDVLLKPPGEYAEGSRTPDQKE